MNESFSLKQTNNKIKFSEPYLFLILNIIDVVLTIISLKIGLNEGNRLFYILGPEVFFASKIFVALLITIFGYYIRPQIRKLLNIGISLICIWNIVLLIITGIIWLTVCI